MYWDKYKIGTANHINLNQNHPYHKIFADFAIERTDSVIEVGPGELIEYQLIKERKPIKYTIVDISTVFINNCRKEYPEIKIVECSMEKLDSKNIEIHDMIYASSCLELSWDIKTTLHNLLCLAREFYFVMYKWNYIGDLTSTFSVELGYWSTWFNIYSLFEEIEKFGKIENRFIIKENGQTIDFDKYQPNSKNKGGDSKLKHADYLVIYGQTYAR